MGNADFIHHQWDILPQQSGIRLDLAVASHLKQSRQQVKTLLQESRVAVNEKFLGVAHKGDRLIAGTHLAVWLPGQVGEWRMLPEPDCPLTILSQGDGYVVIEKPAGQGVHPLTPSETGTVLNALIARFPAIHGVGEGGLRSGVVHRLDVDTSGVLIVATKQAVWEHLRRSFAEHRTVKHYLAVVHGHPPIFGHCQCHLAITRHKPAYVSVLAEASSQSRQCDLTWQVVSQLPSFSVLDITLGTGFLHQIRAMMASLGFAVVGDRVYGDGNTEFGSPVQPTRLMLHANSLTIGSIHVVSHIPEEIRQYLGSFVNQEELSKIESKLIHKSYSSDKAI